ncbi:hypothetical protein KC973_01760 [Candidatus Saccharibacteria bacterium]|nr:hypothetical protein [Candidatus Saccharibacteria bacterium]
MAKVIKFDPESLPDEGGATDDYRPEPHEPARSGAEVMMAGRRVNDAKPAGETAVKGAMIGASLAV